MIRWAGLVSLCAAIVGADRLTKLSMMHRPDDSGPVFSFPGLTTTFHQNFGILANLPVPHFFIITATFVVMIAVILTLRREIHDHRLHRATALTLILAGAIGNLWDRLQWGFVFDWILLGGRSVINIADISIALGIIWYMWERSRTQKDAPTPKL